MPMVVDVVLHRVKLQITTIKYVGTKKKKEEKRTSLQRHALLLAIRKYSIREKKVVSKWRQKLAIFSSLRLTTFQWRRTCIEETFDNIIGLFAISLSPTPFVFIRHFFVLPVVAVHLQLNSYVPSTAYQSQNKLQTKKISTTLNFQLEFLFLSVLLFIVKRSKCCISFSSHLQIWMKCCAIKTRSTYPVPATDMG